MILAVLAAPTERSQGVQILDPLDLWCFQYLFLELNLSLKVPLQVVFRQHSPRHNLCSPGHRLRPFGHHLYSLQLHMHSLRHHFHSIGRLLNCPENQRHCPGYHHNFAWPLLRFPSSTSNFSVSFRVSPRATSTFLAPPAVCHAPPEFLCTDTVLSCPTTVLHFISGLWRRHFS